LVNHAVNARDADNQKFVDSAVARLVAIRNSIPAA
jgi:hypothetical protein